MRSLIKAIFFSFLIIFVFLSIYLPSKREMETNYGNGFTIEEHHKERVERNSYVKTWEEGGVYQ